MLPQLTRPACPRHSRIHLRQHGRKYGRYIHQASSNTETSTVHGCSRASPLWKGLLGFISFRFYFVRVLSHLGSVHLILIVRAGRRLPGYGGTLFLMISHRMRFLRRAPFGHIHSFLLHLFFLVYVSSYGM